MPLKRDNKKTLLGISYNKFFFEDGLHNNHWVGHLLMKPVDAVLFQKIKSLR